MKHLTIVLFFVSTSSFSQSLEEKALEPCSYYIKMCSNRICSGSATAFVINYSNSLYLVSTLHSIAETVFNGSDYVVKNPDQKHIEAIAIYQRIDSINYTRVVLPLYDQYGNPKFRYIKNPDGSNIDVFVARIHTTNRPRFKCLIDSTILYNKDVDIRDSVFSFGCDSALNSKIRQKVWDLYYTTGLTSLFRNNASQTKMDWDMHAQPGRSGSPVFVKSKEGIKLIGIMTNQVNVSRSNVLQKSMCGGIKTAVLKYIIDNYDRLK